MGFVPICASMFYSFPQTHIVGTFFKLNILTQVNRMFRSRRVLAIGGKHCDYGWTGSVFIHFYFLQKVSWRRKQKQVDSILNDKDSECVECF